VLHHSDLSFSDQFLSDQSMSTHKESQQAKEAETRQAKEAETRQAKAKDDDDKQKLQCKSQKAEPTKKFLGTDLYEEKLSLVRGPMDCKICKDAKVDPAKYAQCPISSWESEGTWSHYAYHHIIDSDGKTHIHREDRSKSLYREWSCNLGHEWTAGHPQKATCVHCDWPASSDYWVNHNIVNIVYMEIPVNSIYIKKQK
jgi:hypothetical protein